MAFFSVFFLFIAIATAFSQAADGIHHNLPPGVELVDPKSLGFESQIDLDKLLGNVKLLPINSGLDPKTGTKTQVLTVGFEGDENINLDDFELPQNPNSNNTELVANAFNSFKQYFKNKTVATETKPSVATETKPRGNVVMKRRRVVKTTTTPKPEVAPKVIELDSSQIEKLLATGKLTSKKVGDSQVIEITQEQLNQLYQMENGGEFRELLSPVAMETTTTKPSTTTTTVATTTTTKSPVVLETKPTKPPIIYQFNTKDFDQQQNYPQRNNYVLPQQQQNNYFPQQQQNNYALPQQQQNNFVPFQQQQLKKIKTPTFEFISVPPVSYSTSLAKSPQQQQQNAYLSLPGQQNFRQDPLPSGNKIVFPVENNNNARFHRNIGLNTFYAGDGLNYVPSFNSQFSGI